MRRSWSLAVLAVLVLVTAGRTAQARVVVGDCYAEPDLRGEATALSMQVRSMLAGKEQLAWPQLAAVLGGAGATPSGFYVDSHEAAGVLKQAGGDHLVTWACTSNGVDLVVTVRVTDAQGAKVDAATILGWRADLPQLALAVVDAVGPKLKVVSEPTMVASYGSLQPYVRAGRALLRGDRQTAAQTLLGADPRVARRLPAVARMAAEVWTAIDLPAQDRVHAALVTATPEELLALLPQLGTLPPEDAAGASALALLALGKQPEAEAALASQATSQAPLVLLARAQLADGKNQHEARDQALAPLLAARFLPALRYVASLPAGRCGSLIESNLLAAATAVKSRDPALATAIGLRAAEKNPSALELVAHDLLPEGEEVRLAALIGKLPITYRTMLLRAQLRMRGGDLTGAQRDVDAALASALAEGVEVEPEMGLVRGRIAALRGNWPEAEVQLEAAGKVHLAGRYELARAQVAQKLFDKARSTRLALQDDSSSNEIALADAELLARGNQTAKAVALLEDARKRGSEHPAVLAGLADKYRLAGDADKAQKLDLESAELRERTVKLTAQVLDLGGVWQGELPDAGPKKVQEIVGAQAVVEEKNYNLYYLLAGGLVALVGLAALARAVAPLVLGGGELHVVLVPDPDTTERTYCTSISKLPRSPRVSGDAAKWAAARHKEGVKLGMRGQTLIGNLTKFSIFPGKWFVHVWGVHQKLGELSAMTPVSLPVTVIRGEMVVAEMKLTESALPRCRVTVADEHGPLEGAEVWLDGETQKGTTDVAGLVVLPIKPGPHVLRVKAKGRSVERPIRAGEGDIDVPVKI